MNLTIPDHYYKKAFPYIILTALSLIVWCGGEYLVLENEKRLYIIASLFLAWALKIIFFDASPQKAAFAETAASPEIARKLHVLQGRFQGAMDFLKKTVIHKHGHPMKLANLPWYVLIGPTGSGKTTLLSNAHVNFILTKQIKQENISALATSETCDWRVTRDLVLVDVPGYYLAPKAPKSQKTTAQSDTIWNNLLHLIKTSGRKTPLSGAVIALNFPELNRKPSNQQKTQLVSDIKKRITELREQFDSSLPFYIIITKCDLLPGFLEFFSESGSDELMQGWGVTLPTLQTNEKLADVFNHRFNALIKRLNKQLIWRLHQERNPSARPYIKDFPLHIEGLKETIVSFIKSLGIPDLRLHGVYLTSAIQSVTDESTSYSQAASQGLTHQSLQIMRPPAMPLKAYFIKQVLLQGLLTHFDQLPMIASAAPIYKQKRFVYATSIGTIAIAALALGRDFNEGLQRSHAIQTNLAQYQLYLQQPNKETDTLATTLPLLDALHDAAGNNRHASLFTKLLSFYSNKSEQTANLIYHQALATLIVPEIKNDLEKFLQSNNKNSDYSYAVLKAYLMLADGQNRQSNFIANTINQILPKPLTEDAVDELADHIESALSHPTDVMTLNNDLIAQLRRQIIGLPSIELSLIILKNMDNNNLNSEMNNTDSAASTNKNAIGQLPHMFTGAAFEHILSEGINAAAMETLQGNWVLGNVSPDLDQSSLADLSAQLRGKYITSYVETWENVIGHIQLLSPKNLAQADAIIASLTNNNSPLLKLLQTIKQNTDFAPITAASPKIEGINILLANAMSDQKSPLYQAFIGLRQLHNYLQSILTANDAGHAAFQVAAQRMHSTQDSITQLSQIAGESPEPIKTWLTNIASQSWGLILQEAGQYVQHNWQTEITPFYNSQVVNHFPFNPNSTQEIALPEFIRFMGHQGQLAKFYQTYIKPFANDTGAIWQWRVSDNQKIPFSNKVLAQFQYAMQLQRAFFPNGDNKLFVQFALEPIALESSAKSFGITINGQQMTYQNHSPRSPHTLTWPGTAMSHDTTYNFITNNNRIVKVALNSDWGWFKLVNHAAQNTDSKKEIALNFVANGHTAKYVLFSSAKINPFISSNLTAFELPEDLLGV